MDSWVLKPEQNTPHSKTGIEEYQKCVKLLRNSAFRSNNCIFVYGIRKWSSFILLHVAVQFSQHHLLKRLSLFHWIFFPALSKISWPYICGSISGFSILFDWSECLFLCQYHTILMRSQWGSFWLLFPLPPETCLVRRCCGRGKSGGCRFSPLGFWWFPVLHLGLLSI